PGGPGQLEHLVVDLTSGHVYNRRHLFISADIFTQTGGEVKPGPGRLQRGCCRALVAVESVRRGCAGFGVSYPLPGTPASRNSRSGIGLPLWRSSLEVRRGSPLWVLFLPPLAPRAAA